jgi:hypothetical protein
MRLLVGALLACCFRVVLMKFFSELQFQLANFTFCFYQYITSISAIIFNIYSDSGRMCSCLLIA